MCCFLSLFFRAKGVEGSWTYIGVELGDRGPRAHYAGRCFEGMKERGLLNRALGQFLSAAAIDAFCHLSVLGFFLYLQSQAIAYTLRTAAEAAGPGNNVVAIVNIGTMASIQRNWEVSFFFEV